MRLLTNLLSRRDIWKRILIERATEPLHLNLLSLLVAVFGTTRAKIMFDVTARQWLAYGLLTAADEAKKRGLKAVTAIELGVGTGTGFLNMCELAPRISRVTGVEILLVGFDTGAGLPPPCDFRDHPELYQEGWFHMNPELLSSKLPSFARLVLGNVRETAPAFLDALLPESPVGFAVLDVDYYSSAKDALRAFLGKPDGYLPVVALYVDDVSLLTHNPACGELLAIREFNEENPNRIITFDAFLLHRRIFKHAEWLSHMYNLHVLDHPERNTLRRETAPVVLANPYI